MAGMSERMSKHVRRSNLRWIWSSAVLSLAVAWYSPRVSAAPMTESERAELTEQLLQQGKQAFESKRYQEAYEYLGRAFRLHQSYRTACALGQIELELDKYRDAAEHLQVCILRYPAEDPQQARERVLDGLREARRHVAVFEPTVNLMGATLFINGVEVGTTPFEADLFVEPGLRRVTVRKPGYKDVSAELFFPAGGTVEWHGESVEERRTTTQPQSSQHNAVYLGIGTALTAVTLASGGALAIIAHAESERAANLLERAHRAGDCTVNSAQDVCVDARRRLDDAAMTSNWAVGALWAGAGLGIATIVVHLLANGGQSVDTEHASDTKHVSDAVQPIVHPEMMGAIWSRQF